MRLYGAKERELRCAGECGELPGARGGPLPSLPARLPATSGVSIRGEGVEGACLDACGRIDTKCLFGRELEAEMFTVAAKLHGKKQKKYSFYSKLKSPLKIGKGRNLWVKLVKRRTLPIVYSFLSVVGLNDKPG